MLVRIGLLTDGGYPYATGESGLCCDRLVRGLAQHEFDIYAIYAIYAPSRGAGRPDRGWIQLPPHLCARPFRRVRTAPLQGPAEDGRGHGRRDRRRFAGHFKEPTAALRTARTDDATASDGLAAGRYGLADLAGERGGPSAALRSEAAVRLLESACRTPGARRSVHTATVPDFRAFAAQPERALRPLSLDRYGDDGPAAAEPCHAASGGSAALPGRRAERLKGVPPLVTEYGVQLRGHYLATGVSPATGAPVATVAPVAPAAPSSAHT